MKKIKMLIDDVGFAKKPVDYQMGQIKNRFMNPKCLKELTINELCDYISKGCTFIAGVLENGIKNENWKQQQLIAIDIDNTDKITTPQESVEILKNHGIDVVGYYYTFSSTSEHPKYRLMLLLDEVITERKKIEFINETLIDFLNGDKACKNLDRMFCGTNGMDKVVILNTEATFSLDDIIRLNKNKSTITTKNQELSILIENFDLLEYMKNDNEVSHTSGNITYFKTCSICGHQNCLRYYSDTNSFYCFGANGNTGGSIIEYLMATKNMKKLEAINFFKYDILNLPNKKDNLFNSNSVYLSSVQKQITKRGYSHDFVNEMNFDWILTNEKNKDYVSCPNLYNFIVNNVYYIYVNETAKSGVLRYFYLDGYYKLLSNDQMKGVIKLFIPPSLQNSRDINEVYRLMLYTDDKNFMDMDELNDDENIINFKNGVLHLDTGELKPHSPKYLTTIRIPVNYNPNVPTPSTMYFDNFVKSLTNGDDEILKLLLQFSGVSISNVKGYRMKKALILVGKGNTGKSVLKNFLTRLIGKKNCSNIDLERMEGQFGRIQLLDKRLVGSNDMNFTKVKEVGVFKQAVAGDTIYAEFKGENGININFNGIIWFCANQLPKFGGDKGSWVYDRFVIVKCNNVIPTDKQDKKLVEHLLKEAEYVVSLMVKELQQVIRNGYRYDIPSICDTYNEEYKVENSSFRTFLVECCTKRTEDKIRDNCTKGKIYEVYRKWYVDSGYRGYYYDSKSEVKKIMEELELSNTIKTNGGNEYYTEITLKEDIQREYHYTLGTFIGEDIPIKPPIGTEDIFDDDKLIF